MAYAAQQRHTFYPHKYIVDVYVSIAAFQLLFCLENMNSLSTYALIHIAIFSLHSNVLSKSKDLKRLYGPCLSTKAVDDSQSVVHSVSAPFQKPVIQPQMRSPVYLMLFESHPGRP